MPSTMPGLNVISASGVTPRGVVLGLLIWWLFAGGVWAVTRTMRRNRKRNGELTTIVKPDGSQWLLASGEDRLPIGRILLILVLPPLLILIGYLLSSG